MHSKDRRADRQQWLRDCHRKILKGSAHVEEVVLEGDLTLALDDTNNVAAQILLFGQGFRQGTGAGPITCGWRLHLQ